MWVSFNTLFLIAFLLSVLVQWNDPDPLAWMVVYSLAAASCGGAYGRLQRREAFYLALFTSIGAWGWIVWLLPQTQSVAWGDIVESLQMKSDAVEVAREIGGLLLVAVWSAVIAWRQKKLPLGLNDRS